MRFAPLLLVLFSTPQFTHNRFTAGGKTFSQDGTNLTTACMPKAGDDALMDEMLCTGYVEGIADLLSEGTICVPPEVAGKQLVDATIQYAEKHQEMLHQPASRIVADALKAKYRCR